MKILTIQTSNLMIWQKIIPILNQAKSIDSIWAKMNLCEICALVALHAGCRFPHHPTTSCTSKFVRKIVFVFSWDPCFFSQNFALSNCIYNSNMCLEGQLQKEILVKSKWEIAENMKQPPETKYVHEGTTKETTTWCRVILLLTFWNMSAVCKLLCFETDVNKNKHCISFVSMCGCIIKHMHHWITNNWSKSFPSDSWFHDADHIYCRDCPAGLWLQKRVSDFHVLPIETHGYVHTELIVCGIFSVWTAPKDLAFFPCKVWLSHALSDCGSVTAGVVVGPWFHVTYFLKRGSEFYKESKMRFRGSFHFGQSALIDCNVGGAWRPVCIMICDRVSTKLPTFQDITNDGWPQFSAVLLQVFHAEWPSWVVLLSSLFWAGHPGPSFSLLVTKCCCHVAHNLRMAVQAPECWHVASAFFLFVRMSQC